MRPETILLKSIGAGAGGLSGDWHRCYYGHLYCKSGGTGGLIDTVGESICLACKLGTQYEGMNPGTSVQTVRIPTVTTLPN